MRRLHYYCCEYANRSEGKQPGVARHGKLGKVYRITEGFESFLHVMNSKKQESETGKNVSNAFH